MFLLDLSFYYGPYYLVTCFTSTSC